MHPTLQLQWIVNILTQFNATYSSQNNFKLLAQPLAELQPVKVKRIGNDPFANPVTFTCEVFNIGYQAAVYQWTNLETSRENTIFMLTHGHDVNQLQEMLSVIEAIKII